MKKIVVSIIAASSISAYASCVGDESYRSCYDAKSGNSYTTQTYGDTSYTTGRNSNTGSTWSQNSTQIGDTTIHNGRAANGNTWSGTSTTIGDTTFHRGTDSRGNPYSGTTRNRD